MKKKLVWIIGANSDVAKELMKLMNGKYKFIAAARNLVGLKEYISYEKIENVEPIELDVCNEEQMRDFMGSRRTPDIIIFALGVLKTEKNVAEYLEEMVTCNYTACVKIIEEVWPAMELTGDGCIVGITSVAADRGKMSNKLYSSTKAAMSSYLQALMQEGGKKGIRVIDVKPGYIRTKMLESYPKAYHSILAAEPVAVAKEIIKKIESGRGGTIYVKKVWRIIMYILKRIPERIYIGMQL